MSKQPPPAPTTSAVGPCPTVIQIVGRPGTGSLPSTIAPPDHPRAYRETKRQSDNQPARRKDNQRERKRDRERDRDRQTETETERQRGRDENSFTYTAATSLLNFSNQLFFS